MNAKGILSIIALFVILGALGWYVLRMPPPQQQGSQNQQATSTQEVAGIECEDSPSYFVVAKNNEGEPGQSILLKRKAAATQAFPCEYAKAPGDLEMSISGPIYFLGITGNFLLLDSGTAPHPRGLTVYDITKEQDVYTDQYNVPTDIEGDTFTYWQPAEVPVTVSNCPDLVEWTKNGLSGSLERHVSLDLTTLKVKDLGQTRCSARQ